MVSPPGRPPSPLPATGLSGGIDVESYSDGDRSTDIKTFCGRPMIPVIEINEQRLLPAAPIVPRALRPRVARHTVPHAESPIVIDIASIPSRSNWSDSKRGVVVAPAKSVSAPGILALRGIEGLGVTESQPPGSPEVAAVSIATRGYVAKAHELPQPVALQRGGTFLSPERPSHTTSTTQSQDSPPGPIAQNAIARCRVWNLSRGVSSEGMQHMKRRERGVGPYWCPPPGSRVEFVPDPESVKARASLPSHASRMPVDEVPIYHTQQGTFDESGRLLLDLKRPYKDVALASWMANVAVAEPIEPPGEEVESLSECVCEGCLRRGPVPLTNAVDESARRYGRVPLMIRVTTVVESKVEKIPPTTPPRDVRADHPFVVNLIAEGYSAFFDPSIQGEDLAVLAIPKEPFFPPQLLTTPLGSTDMLDLVDAPPDVRSKVNLILPPYLGKDHVSGASQSASCPLPTTTSRPIQYGFDLCLRYNDDIYPQLRLIRNRAWDNVHKVRADFLELIRLESWRMTHGATSPTYGVPAKMISAERRSHIDYKGDVSSNAVEQYLIAQRTLECYEDSPRIRDKEIAHFGVGPDNERDAQRLRPAHDAIRSATTTALSTSADIAGFIAFARTRYSDATGEMPDATPRVLVSASTVSSGARTDESTESELEPISPVEEEPPVRTLSLLTSVLEVCDFEYRYPETNAKEPQVLDESASSHLADPLYPRVAECSNVSPSVEGMGFGIADASRTGTRSQTPTPPRPSPPVPDESALFEPGPFKWAERVPVFDHPVEVSWPPLRPRVGPRSLSHDAATRLACEDPTFPQAYHPFSRSVDFLLLPRIDPNAIPTPATRPALSFSKSPPRLTRLQSFSNKLTGRKPPRQPYEPSQDPGENIVAREKQASTKTHPTGTIRSLNFLRRSNASTQTLTVLERHVAPEPTMEEDAYARLVREAAEKEQGLSAARKAFRQWRAFKTEMKIKADGYREKLEELKARWA